MGTKVLGRPAGKKESSQRTMLGVGVAQHTGRGTWGNEGTCSQMLTQGKCSQRGLGYICLPRFPSFLMHLTSPQSITPWDSHALFPLQKGLNKGPGTSEITEFQDQLEWHHPSVYSSKCSTEAAWLFPVVSKLPVCPLQSSWAGPASPPFSRSLVSLCWPWPSWQWAHRRVWRCSLLLMCWEHSEEMKCRLCTVPYAEVSPSKLDTMEQVGHGSAWGGSVEVL